MNAHSFLLISTLIYLISLVNFSSTQCVPVYMWEEIKYNDITPALEVLDQKSFLNLLENKLNKKNPVLVFAEQSLSSEDFLLRNAKDENVLSTLSSSTVNYWPCVKNSVDAVEKLKDRNVITTPLSKFLTDSINLKPSDVLIIDLNDANEEEDRINMLQRHNEIIAKIYQYFKKHSSGVTIIFTGRQPSWITVDEVRSHRRIRDTSKVEANVPKADVSKAEVPKPAEIPYVVYSNEDVLISAVDSPAIYNDGRRISLQNATILTENKTKDGLNIIMSVPEEVSVNWRFQIGGGYWILKELLVTNLSASANETEYFYRIKEIYAPYRFSYHCTNQTFTRPNNRNQNMTFDFLQLQVYFEGDVQNGTFGDSFDCTGFMSAPIWSGLFVTFILVLIMTCGLTMMMDIKTMDRFDDPKGKTITINASE